MKRIEFIDLIEMSLGNSNKYKNLKISGKVNYEVHCIESSIENPKIFEEEIDFEIIGYLKVYKNGKFEILIEKTNLPDNILENEEFENTIYKILEKEINLEKLKDITDVELEVEIELEDRIEMDCGT